MENGPVCPFEHVISQHEILDGGSGLILFRLECQGVVYAEKKFNRYTNDQAAISIWTHVENDKHLIDYLQQTVVTLREAVGELEVLRKNCVEHHDG